VTITEVSCLNLRPPTTETPPTHTCAL